MNRMALQIFFVGLLTLLFVPKTVADMNAKAMPMPSKTTEAEELVLSAPPRGTAAAEKAIYEPIAEFLSKAIGKKVAFKYSDNWLSYSKGMVQGGYDVVFDGPHFIGWRQDKLGHVPLIKIKEDLVFVLITKVENESVTAVKNLAGRTVCAHAPPNLGTLTLLSQFDNPYRQPSITQIEGWENAYKGLIDGRCEATFIPLKNLAKFDAGENKLTKVIYKSRNLPNQAFSAGRRVSPEMQAKIRQALLSEEGKKATEKLREAYAVKEFALATKEEYAGLGKLLKDTMYFE